jgi:ATP-dependent DNA helicase RecG
LDHETNKELLLKHIRENDVEGSPLRDLCEVLPSLARPQVQALLQELKDEGRVKMAGSRRWARWHVATTPPDSSKASD